MHQLLSLFSCIHLTRLTRSSALRRCLYNIDGLFINAIKSCEKNVFIKNWLDISIIQIRFLIFIHNFIVSAKGDDVNKLEISESR